MALQAPTLGELESSPAFPYWGQDLVREVQLHDIVDALNVLDAVSAALSARFEEATR